MKKRTMLFGALLLCGMGCGNDEGAAATEGGGSAQAGPTGEQGERGEQGPPGPEGPMGASGSPGGGTRWVDGDGNDIAVVTQFNNNLHVLDDDGTVWQHNLTVPLPPEPISDSPLYFASNDCTGAAHVSVYAVNYAFSIQGAGSFVAPPGVATFQELDFLSRDSGGGCEMLGGSRYVIEQSEAVAVVPTSNPLFVLPPQPLLP